ncbi:MAG: sulfonate transport system substrate-binding protein [Hyphomicrobiales bacterium]|nr:sulfonate transport system substrate-binding protein [Hyphomicrobiales bacterium]
MKSILVPLIPAKAGIQFLAKGLGPRFRGDERSYVRLAFCGLLVLLAALAPARAEVNEIKIGKQYGLPYIQFVIMEDGKLIEKHAKAQGLGDVKVEWATLGGPAQLNDGIISGAIDVAGVGLPNLITMWEKTRINAKVRAIAGLNFMPLILLTRGPRIKTLKDYGEKDRIAVPSVKISMQAILLEMAAAKEFGEGNYEKLDPLTVSMGHPDAFAALNSGTEVGSHFSSAPFQNRQLKMPGYHQVVSSYDIIGPHSVSCIVMTTKFHDGNPKTVAALLGAMKEATAWIKADKKAAAEAYLRVTKDKMPVDELLAMLNDPNIVITIVPKGADKIGDFLAKVGRVKAKPDRWQDYYFGDVDKLTD